MKKDIFFIKTDWSVEEKEGYIFTVNKRKFGLYTDISHRIIDLYTGCRVFWFQNNNLLPLSTKQLINVARKYIIYISDDQFKAAEERLLKEYPSFKLPLNE